MKNRRFSLEAGHIFKPKIVKFLKYFRIFLFVKIPDNFHGRIGYIKVRIATPCFSVKIYLCRESVTNINNCKDMRVTRPREAEPAADVMNNIFFNLPMKFGYIFFTYFYGINDITCISLR